MMKYIVEHPLIIFLIQGILELVVAPLLYFWLARKEMTNNESNTNEH